MLSGSFQGESVKAFITGITGFAGSHLAESLLPKAEVWGTYLHDDFSNIDGAPGLNLIRCDLTEKNTVCQAVERVRPDVVFHLAAQSSPSISLKDPGETLKANIFASLNVFEAVADISPNTVIVNIGSGDEYGDADQGDLPVTESAELKPLTPYAVSKIAQDFLAYQYWRSKGLKTIRCRPFNHFGPRQSEAFVSADFAKQIAEIEAGVKAEKVIRVGNLGAEKDFLDVRDVIAAYGVLADRGEYGAVYNICSGRAVKIQRILDILVSFSTERIEVVRDARKMRSADTRVLYGDASKLRLLGWAPEYSLEEGLEDLLNYWREKVRA